MNELIVLKLGGSAITYKKENKFEMNYSILGRAAQEIKKVLGVKKNLELIVVCGVGPFGHSNVVKYDLNKKIETEKQEMGIGITNADCDFVGSEVVNVLKKVGLKSKLVSGYEVCEQKNKNVEKFNLTQYKKNIKSGIISVTTGIMVPDKELVWSVMSGDQVIAQVARYLNARKVLIGTDVGGIFTEDPKENPKAELIELITKENLNKVLQKCSGSKSIDVTGGMKGKLEKLSKTLDGVPAEIFSLFIKGNLEKALLGKEIKSTKIKL